MLAYTVQRLKGGTHNGERYMQKNMAAKQHLTLLVLFTVTLISVTSANKDKTYFLYTDCVTTSPPRVMDKAWISIVTTNDGSQPGTDEQTHFQLRGQVSACYKCSQVHLFNISHTQNCTFLADTKFDVTFSVYNTTSGKVIWSNTIKHMPEYARFALYVTSHQGDVTFDWAQMDAGHDAFKPIYVSMAIIAAVCVVSVIVGVLRRKGILHWLVAYCHRHEKQQVQSQNNDETPADIACSQPKEAVTEQKQGRTRLRSLDTFRGLSLTIMMFVNYGGGGYWFLNHSYWNGLTVADLVFPWFTWIMGTSIALSFHNMLHKGVSRKSIFLKVIRRSAILFALGLIINTLKGPVSLGELRIPGVLQRLAFSYLCVALVQTVFAPRDNPHVISRFAALRDMTAYLPEWLIMLCFLLIHLLITFLLPVQGCPRGYLGPGGLSDDSAHPLCTGGAAALVDKWIFGRSHIYHHPTCMNTYHTTQPYDPEGLLGSLTSVFLCFLGLQAGKIFLIHKNWRSRVIRFLIWGTVLGLIAGGLCGFTQNNGVIPVNKNLWSVSFILCMSSMAFFLIAGLYVVIDVLCAWNGAPFHYPGMNSIVVYVCHEVFANCFPVTWVVSDTHTAHMALQAWGVSLWVLMAAVMYHKHIFVAI